MAKKDSKLREEIGMYEQLMEDAEDLANIFIGNDTLSEYSDAGEYEPFLHLLAQFHFEPENENVYNALKKKINLIKKKVLDLSTQIDNNHKKGKFIYRNR